MCYQVTALSLKAVSLFLLFHVFSNAYGRENFNKNIEEPEKKLIIKKMVDVTPVKDQFKTGTCWSFCTLSFLESELIRMGKGEFDLAEMYIVRHTYQEKADKYIRMHGKTNFAAGGEPNDVTNVIDKYGIVPEEVYQGLHVDSLKHNHKEMNLLLTDYLKTILGIKGELSGVWKEGFSGILNAYLGEVPEMFAWNGDVYTPQGFARELGIKGSDYVMLTSFTHHPYYKPFVLEIPDNWSWGEAYNVKLDELVEITDRALNNNYSLVWASDVSEDGFNHKKGFAVAPEFVYESKNESKYRDYAKLTDKEKEKIFFASKDPIEEVEVTDKIRQESFDNQTTTDDHGMHIVGLAFDENGKKYYYVKNSWGTDNPFDGYLYVSEAYFRYKTMSIMVHKEALPGALRRKLNIK